MSEIDEVARAKADLEAAGQQWNTPCDAYRITNLVAYRNGWKVVQKLSGDNCQGRKVDGIIKDGVVYDCLVNAGPPMNANTPSWGYVGPQAGLVALDPAPDSVDSNPNPPVDDMNEKLDQILAALEQLRIQSDNNTHAIINTNNENTEKIQQQIHQVVQDAENSLKQMLPVLDRICKFEAPSTLRTEKKSAR